jgi:hypothetical protein
MPATYTLISSATVGSGGASNIDFTSIPQTYTDLLIRTSIRSSPAATNIAINLNFNNSSTNRSIRYLYGNPPGGNAISGSSTTAYDGGISPAATTTANTFNSGEIYIANYRTSNNKPLSIFSVTEDNSSTAFIFSVAALWSNSAAITSIKLIPNSGTFDQYSTAYLYGISNA